MKETVTTMQSEKFQFARK